MSVGSATEPASDARAPAAFEPGLRFEGVSKRFGLQHERIRSFQELWVRLLRRTRVAEWEDFWALRDVSFEVHAGEMLGVIGRNGSGKSTLLRLAARTMRPTSGRVLIRGRVAPLLDLGSGFHPELSGRDNIYLNGCILGLSRAEIDERYGDIVQFSELDHFIDTPLKHYSTGMWLRLGFSVAAYTDADVLLVDEALGVGDAEFRQKCLDRIDDFRKRGKTILLVSHDLAQVAETCDRALWLDHGQIRALGPSAHVVAEYLQHGEPPVR